MAQVISRGIHVKATHASFITRPILNDNIMELWRVERGTRMHIAIQELEGTDELHDGKKDHHDCSISHQIFIFASMRFCLFPTFVGAPLKDVCDDKATRV